MDFTRWTFVKVLEVGFCVACLICKRVTDDEAARLFLYLQKLSREWSLLNNVTWDRFGAAVADASYGGYVIITAALLIGSLTGELPTVRRISERVFLGVGALLFIVLGSLEFAALDSVPPDLVDNAAVLGTLSLVTAALFLLDMGGPHAKPPATKPNETKTQTKISKPLESSPERPDSFAVESEIQRLERKELEAIEEYSKRAKAAREQGGHRSGHNGFGPKLTGQNGFKSSQNGYKKMKEKDEAKTFDIYGKDAVDYGLEKTWKLSSDTDRHSPVWSQIRKGHYGKYDIEAPPYIYPEKESDHRDPRPSGPGDPGYVQYTAQRWGQPSQKTPRHSPTE